MSIQQNINQLLTMASVGAYIGKKGFEDYVATEGRKLKTDVSKTIEGQARIEASKEKEKEKFVSEAEQKRIDREIGELQEESGYIEEYIQGERLDLDAIEAVKQKGGAWGERQYYKDVRKEFAKSRSNWREIAKSQFQAERERKDFIRQLKAKDDPSTLVPFVRPQMAINPATRKEYKYE